MDCVNTESQVQLLYRCYVSFYFSGHRAVHRAAVDIGWSSARSSCWCLEVSTRAPGKQAHWTGVMVVTVCLISATDEVTKKLNPLKINHLLFEIKCKKSNEFVKTCVRDCIYTIHSHLRTSSLLISLCLCRHLPSPAYNGGLIRLRNVGRLKTVSEFDSSIVGTGKWKSLQAWIQLRIYCS